MDDSSWCESCKRWILSTSSHRPVSDEHDSFSVRTDPHSFSILPQAREYLASIEIVGIEPYLR